MSTPPPVALSFSRLSLYSACPLRYRYLEVDGTPEPDVPPDWRHARARLGPAAIASPFDRSFGVAVHAGLAGWQRGVDGGASPTAAGLFAAVRSAAARSRLDPTRVEAALAHLEEGLGSYATGPWPRRATLFLEHRVTHRLTAPDGFAVELHLRVDRVARFRRGVAIIDFKTVSPHAFELRVDRWQLHTYALAAPSLLGVASDRVHLGLIDLRQGTEIEVGASTSELAAAAEELLGDARRIAAADFAVTGHPDRPCWSCGFRVQCPSSLVPAPG